MQTRENDDLMRELRDFYEDYSTCLDSNDFERWPSFFLDDARYRIISREDFTRGLPLGAMTCEGVGMIHDRVTALVKVPVYYPRVWRRFVSSIQLLSSKGGVIESRANFLLYESLMDREPRVNMLGQYVDTLVHANGSFKIKSRDCVYDNYRIHTTLYAPA